MKVAEYERGSVEAVEYSCVLLCNAFRFSATLQLGPGSNACVDGRVAPFGDDVETFNVVVVRVRNENGVDVA